MRTKKLLFGFLILVLLSCNYVTQMIVPPTATAVPTATATLTASPTATETPVPLVPAYVPPDCASSPLATVAPDVVTPTEELPTDENLSQQEQLEILHEMENIVEENYVYPDYNGKDWNGIKARYEAMVEAGLSTEAFYQQLENMVEELGDEHSFFLSPIAVERSQEELKGENSFVGIGVSVDADIQHGSLTVISVFPDSPAEKAGIKTHDSILMVDGRPAVEDQQNRVRGPECSALRLTIQSPGEAPRDLLLVRYEIKSNYRIDARLVPTTDGSKIGYIFIPTFFDETIPPQIRDALESFGKLDGLILDVRMNSGGSSIVANPIMSFFTSGRLGRFVSRTESRPLELDADPIYNSQTVPLVVMVSEGTVSYGEIFAGIMRDSRNAKITGETSLGNVEVLLGYNLPDDSKLWLASERFFPEHSDQNWEETGIVPDVQAYAPWNTFTFDNDPSIAEALNLLGHH